jgi:hypothetical protein
MSIPHRSFVGTARHIFLELNYFNNSPILQVQQSVRLRQDQMTMNKSMLIGALAGAAIVTAGRRWSGGADPGWQQCKR